MISSVENNVKEIGTTWDSWQISRRTTSKVVSEFTCQFDGIGGKKSKRKNQGKKAMEKKQLYLLLFRIVYSKNDYSRHKTI